MQKALAVCYSTSTRAKADSDWPRRHRLPTELRPLEPKQPETDVLPFSASIPRKPGRTLHHAQPERMAGFEMKSRTTDGMIPQSSLLEVPKRTDKIFQVCLDEPPEDPQQVRWAHVHFARSGSLSWEIKI